MDRPGRRKNYVTNCLHLKFGGNAYTASTLFHPVNAHLPFICMPRALKALAPVGTGNTRPPPIRRRFLPEQPFPPRLVGQQVFPRKSLRNRKPLRSFAD